MTILTDAFIRASFPKSDVTVPDPTVAYVRGVLESNEFLRPHEGKLYEIDNVGKLLEWIPLVYPSVISNYIMGRINRLNTPNCNMSVLEMKEIILSSLASILLQHGEMAIPNRNPYEPASILPWDVQTGIVETSELFRLFGFNQVQNRLDVTFTVQGVDHKDMWSLDFAMGVLTFCKVYGVNCEPRMFGYPLGSDNHHYRYLEVFTSEYSVEILGIEDPFNFDGLDFMHGFSTAAVLAGVNHRDYWKNLRQYRGEDSEWEEDEDEDEGEGTPVDF